MNPTDRYLIISADAHAGLPCEDYRPYLESQYHGSFDDFLARFRSKKRGPRLRPRRRRCRP